MKEIKIADADQSQCVIFLISFRFFFSPFSSHFSLVSFLIVPSRPQLRKAHSRRVRHDSQVSTSFRSKNVRHTHVTDVHLYGAGTMHGW